MENFEMRIEGTFGVKFLSSDGQELDTQEQQIVYNGLKNGDFAVSMNTKKIYNLSDLTHHIYQLQILSSDDVRFAWSETPN
jgi:hypothetical protein